MPAGTENPDSLPIAWHNPLTNISYLVIGATYRGTYPSTGPNLSALLQHDCTKPVYPPVSLNASHTYEPSTYDNYQWLQSVRVFPNGSGLALVHNEMHGELSNNSSLCSHGPVHTGQKQCILWSTVLGTSSNGGATWGRPHGTTETPVFTLPRRYEMDAKLAGYGALGSMLFNEEDGWYYGHVNRVYWNGTGGGPPPSPNTSRSGLTSGVCTWRSRNPTDASTFRGWNGSAWSTTWVNPYKHPVAEQNLWRHTCATIDTGELTAPSTAIDPDPHTNTDLYLPLCTWNPTTRFNVLIRKISLWKRAS
jgi:hypothetical protein